MAISPQEAVIASGERSPDSLDFYRFHMRTLLIYAARLIERVPRGERDCDLTIERRAELAEVGRSAALSSIHKHFADGFVKQQRAHRISNNTIAKRRDPRRRVLSTSPSARGSGRAILDELLPPGFRTGYKPKRVFWTHEQAAKVLAAPRGGGGRGTRCGSRRAVRPGRWPACGDRGSDGRSGPRRG